MNLVKSTFLVLIFIWCVSCDGRFSRDNDEDVNHLEKSKEYFTDFLISQDRIYLDSSYSELLLNKLFVDKGITNENKYHVIPLFMYLKNYNELENLLIKYSSRDSINIVENTTILNLVKYLNSSDANNKTYIQKNLSILSSEIDKHSSDSLLYINYFINRMYLVGKKESLREIDSMQNVNQEFSEEFYDLMLKESIKEYPEEFFSTGASF